LRDGLAALANEHSIAVRQSGPPQMPLIHKNAPQRDPTIDESGAVLGENGEIAE